LSATESAPKHAFKTEQGKDGRVKRGGLKGPGPRRLLPPKSGGGWTRLKLPGLGNKDHLNEGPGGTEEFPGEGASRKPSWLGKVGFDERCFFPPPKIPGFWEI